MQNKLFQQMGDLLTKPGPRLPDVCRWLMDEVWSEQRYGDCSPQQYLDHGERLVLKAEELILNAAPSLYDELVADSMRTERIVECYRRDPHVAVIVFDGCSLREIPVLLGLAHRSGFVVRETGFRSAALPSDTRSYVSQRILGKEIGPSQLEGRKELTQQGIKVYYYDTSIRSFELQADGPMLLWSSFPDGTYMNFEARTSDHFESIVKQFDVAWQRTVMAVPKGYRVVVTSDHGYIYLGTRLESERRAEEALRVLNNDRFRTVAAGEDLPSDLPELQVIPTLRLAMLRGRVKNRAQGPAGNKVFRHGGISLMEMLTPWIVLERV